MSEATMRAQMGTTIQDLMDAGPKTGHRAGRHQLGLFRARLGRPPGAGHQGRDHGADRGEPGGRAGARGLHPGGPLDHAVRHRSGRSSRSRTTSATSAWAATSSARAPPMTTAPTASPTTAWATCPSCARCRGWRSSCPGLRASSMRCSGPRTPTGHRPTSAWRPAEQRRTGPSLRAVGGRAARGTRAVHGGRRPDARARARGGQGPARDRPLLHDGGALRCRDAARRGDPGPGRRRSIIVVSSRTRRARRPEIVTALRPHLVRLEAIGVPRRVLSNYGTAEEHDAEVGLTSDGIRARIEAFLGRTLDVARYPTRRRRRLPRWARGTSPLSPAFRGRVEVPTGGRRTRRQPRGRQPTTRRPRRSAASIRWSPSPTPSGRSRRSTGRRSPSRATTSW